MPAACLLVIAVLLAACATLERGTTDTLAHVTDPPGAPATSSEGPSCVTPCGLKAGRRDEFSVTIAKAGFVPQTVAVKTRLSDPGIGFFMENVVTAGLGAGVDAATGATLEHVPDPVSVALVAVSAVPGRGKPRS